MRNLREGRGVFFLLSGLIVLVGLAPAGLRAATANNWQTETVDDDGQVGWSTSLELDSAGRPHISYFDYTHNDLKYAHWDGSAWHIEPVDSAGQVGRDTSLALDADDNAHISYYDLLNMDLKYARWDGAIWHKEPVDSSGMVGEYSSLALDSQGFAHIAYFDYSNNSLEYARWNGSAWLIETLAEDAWDPPSLAVDGDDRPHIAYGQYGNVMYARRDGSDWQTEPVVGDGSAGWITALTLDADGRPHIAYLDVVEYELQYAFWDGDNWQVEKVVTYGEETAVDSLSLALGPGGEPHIAYTSQSMVPHTILRHAYREGANWLTETIDDGAAGETTLDTGYFPSIAVDGAGRPHVSYNRRVDQETEELMYAVIPDQDLAYRLYLPVIVDQSAP